MGPALCAVQCISQGLSSRSCCWTPSLRHHHLQFPPLHHFFFCKAAFNTVMDSPKFTWKQLLGVGLLFAWFLQSSAKGLFNAFYHPLAKFPGPKVAASTAWYKTYQELYLGRSWIDVLQELHGKYGIPRLNNLAK